MLPRGPRLLLVAGSIGLVVAVGAITALVLSPSMQASPSPTPAATPSPTPTARPTPTPSPTPSPSPTPEARCPITGLPLDAALPSDQVGLTVQIDNDPHARPQTGLSAADLIVEATVQGNVTRFGAVFYCNDPGVAVGPIRSARYYNLDLWQQVGALTVGFGGAPYTLQHYIDGGMPYLNGADGWGYFYRSVERIAPYNVYSDLDVIRRDLSDGLLEQFEINIDALRPPFEVSPEPDMPAGRSVTHLDIATNGYWRYSFTYEGVESGYSRADGSDVMVDAATLQPVTVRTVVVQRVSQQEIFGIDFGAGGNPILHELVGSGTGTAYVDGQAYDVEWTRPDAASTTSWIHAGSGEPLELPPGPIWWQILPYSAAVTES